MSRALSCTLLIGVVLLAATACFAQPVPPGSTVGVVPLTFRYRVDQEYQTTVMQADASLKGHFRENSSASHRASVRESDHMGYTSSGYSASESASARSSGSGNYDLKSHQRVQVESYNDRTVIEKSLDSSLLTGILESALSEAGIRVADRSQLGRVQAERDFNKQNGQKQSAIRAADYLLNGQIDSMRIEGVRNVPDGTNQRYAVGGVIKLSIKLTDTRSGVSDYARTFTGNARKTFNAADPVPADEVMEAAMNDLAQKITAALTGNAARAGGATEDDEYQDSPGKRLKE